MATSRLCAASRAVSRRPRSRSVSPTCHCATSAASRQSRSTTRPGLAVNAAGMPSQVSVGGGSSRAGPEPSSSTVTKRVAAQLGISATGSVAAWHGSAATLTSSTVARPPSPCAPMPSALMRSNNSSRRRSVSFAGPLSRSAWISIGLNKARLAASMACSGVPPTPTPSTPGGHQPAPICGMAARIQSTSESLGLSVANFALTSPPPPLATTVILMVLPGTSSSCRKPGVLSPVLRRSPRAEPTMVARSGLALCV